MLSAIRDSSLDYRTYWLQNGLYYSRRGLGDAGSCGLPDDKLRQIPEDDRKVLLDEVSSDPVFCQRVAKCMATNPNWGHVIAASAKEAIANELDPSLFPARRGTWPKLRERVRALLEVAVQDVKTAAATGSVRKVGRQKELSGLGQWDIIANLVGAVATTAGNVYMTGVSNRAQIDIQRDQANAAIAAAQAQMNAINAAGGMQTASATINPISSIMSATVAGIPVIALAIPAAGLIWYFATKN